MSVEVKTYEQILGEMIRKIVADTNLNDLNPGSVILTLLEASAQNDFENNAAILNLLQLLSLDATSDSDLDARGADLGLERIVALRSSGTVDISDSSISKISTKLYQVKPAPIAGSTKIYVNDASSWAPSGEIFIGRGTPNFEGPISYTSIVDNNTFYEVNLSTALEKDHLISDEVVNGQGTVNRLIPAGTRVLIPANNQNPEIVYKTLRDAVIPAGEDTVSGVLISSILAGSNNNAGINTITQFESPPFTSAAVSNPIALTNGRDVESDESYRDRIKSYPNTLARGTKQAILDAIIGLSDPVDNKQVSSAVITEPPKIGDPSICYIDDGSGFQPSFDGQSVDSLLRNASGTEEFLQLANYPIPRPQVVNNITGPYEIADGMRLTVIVDGREESVTFSNSDFLNPTSATIAEIIVAINDQSNNFEARFTEDSSKILLSTASADAETIQVLGLTPAEDEFLHANNVLGFPTNEFSQIKLYKNSTLLREKEKSASLLTTEFNTWNILTDESITLSVDNTPQQTATFSEDDFSPTPFGATTLEDWVRIFNTKFAGLTATATASGKMEIISNKEGSTSSIDVLSGGLSSVWFANLATSSTGQDAEFQLNRQTGNLRILTSIEAGDSITAGTEDAKGNVVSSETLSGSYNLSTDDSGRSADIIMTTDSSETTSRVSIGIAAGNILVVSDEGNSTMRIRSNSIGTFRALIPGDYIYIVKRNVADGWIDEANTGMHKITAKGAHTQADVDTWIEMQSYNIVAGVHTVIDALDIRAFNSDVYPQIWSGSQLANPTSALIQDIIDSILSNTVNTNSGVFKTNSIKLSSATENNGNIATPIVVANASSLFTSEIDNQNGNPSPIANKTSTEDMVSFFKRTNPTNVDAGDVSGKSVWLGRYAYSDVNGSLEESTSPDGTTYGETLTSNSFDAIGPSDYISIIQGANKGHYKTIKDILPNNEIGTQVTLPKTIMNYSENDRFSLFKPSSINPNDSIIFIMDNDASAKTIDINMSRTGRISSSVPATSLSFNAIDYDNEPGIEFDNLQTWGKETNGTEFKDYAVWMRARNWYQAGGAGSGGAAMIIRSSEYGPHGEKIKFQLEYPSAPSLSEEFSHNSKPDYSLATYYFGSGSAKNIAITPGVLIHVSESSPNIFRYEFQSAVDLSTLIVGDIISVKDDAGISSANSGVYRLTAVDDVGNYFEIYNPNGSATGIGAPEITQVDTVDDVLGAATSSVITTVSAASLDGDYFVLEDKNGTVGVYYEVSTPNPGAGSLGVNRTITVSLSGGDSAATVATKTYAAVVSDPEFTSAVPAGSTVVINNSEQGAFAVGVDGASATGFTFGGTLGIDPVSLNGSYFILQDAAGSVGVWYDSTGITAVPYGAASQNRNIRISINAGDADDVVASKTAAILSLDSAWASVVIGGVNSNELTITDATQGGRNSANSGDTGFTVVQSQNGVTPGSETIITPTSVSFYPIEKNTVADIISKVNDSLIMKVAAIGLDSLAFDKATRDELYTPAGVDDYSISLAYGHNPDASLNNHHWVSLYDSQFYVKEFLNSDPQFTLKTPMILQGSSIAYSVDSAPNEDTADTGELFKLVPVSLNNIYHQLTQKALSQLEIISSVDIADNFRSVQVKSKELGSDGAIEVIGGNANDISLSIFDAASISTGISNSYTEIRTAAYPITLSTGDLVKVENTIPSNRATKLGNGDTIDVQQIADDTLYKYNGKPTNINKFVEFSVTDVSASYSRDAGIVWRWAHSDSGSTVTVTDRTLGVPANAANDKVEDGSSDAVQLDVSVNDAGTVSTYQEFVLGAYGPTSQGDFYCFESASGATFAVWFDVDANGTAPTAAEYIAATHKIEVDILSTDTADQVVSKLSDAISGNVNFTTEFVSAQSNGANFSNTNEGDLLVVTGTDDVNWPVGNINTTGGSNKVSGFPVINVDAASSYIDVVNINGAVMTDVLIGDTRSVTINPSPVIEWTPLHDTTTYYKIESMGFKNLYKLSHVSGTEPKFLDVGVAVDDTLFIQGTTLKSNNRGSFRVLGVDSDSIIFENSIGGEELDTLVKFNDAGDNVQWQGNNTTVLGVVGSFENLQLGDWVKKESDSDSFYVQIADFLDALDVSTTPALATKLSLVSAYNGNTDTATGIGYNQETGHNSGIKLKDASDIKFFEGDSVRIGDTLFIDSIVTSGWFNQTNTGTFDVTEFGTDGSTGKPYVKVKNINGVTENNIKVDIDTKGFNIVEGQTNLYQSIRSVENSIIDQFNDTRRTHYLFPPGKEYKMTQANGTKITPIGKLGYKSDIVSGVDGYLYYTGLLRTVQRTIDGFEPDPSNFPGKRAVGGVIETLPPLINQIKISIDVTTNDGVNINEISDDITSAVINYIGELGVGEDVIMSQIIAAILGIKGVAAATFLVPSANTERITIADNEKAFIEAKDISIS